MGLGVVSLGSALVGPRGVIVEGAFYSRRETSYTPFFEYTTRLGSQIILASRRAV